MDEDRVSAFLNLGWDATCEAEDELSPWLSLDTECRGDLAACDYSVLLDRGVEAFSEACAPQSSGINVVPLSGGRDSRAVLAALLRHGCRRSVVAVTWGTPGTTDFELGRYVAQRAKVPHEHIDLTRLVIDRDDLVRFAAQCPAPVYLFSAYFNSLPFERFGSGATYWSGYLGEPIAGLHLVLPESPTWEDALNTWIKMNRFQQAVQLERPGFDPRSTLPSAPRLPRGLLTYDDELEFTCFQPRCRRRALIPPGFDCRTPFAEASWANFILNVSPQYRMALYAAVLDRGFPALFSLPTKNKGLRPLHAGAVRGFATKVGAYAAIRAKRLPRPRVWRSRLSTNYIDLARAIRQRRDVHAIVHDALGDLSQRGSVPWLDLDALWNDHQNGRDLSAALGLLTSLSVYLQAHGG